MYDISCIAGRFWYQKALNREHLRKLRKDYVQEWTSCGWGREKRCFTVTTTFLLKNNWSEHTQAENKRNQIIGYRMGNLHITKWFFFRVSYYKYTLPFNSFHSIQLNQSHLKSKFYWTLWNVYYYVISVEKYQNTDWSRKSFRKLQYLLNGIIF